MLCAENTQLEGRLWPLFVDMRVRKRGIPTHSTRKKKKRSRSIKDESIKGANKRRLIAVKQEPGPIDNRAHCVLDDDTTSEFIFKLFSLFCHLPENLLWTIAPFVGATVSLRRSKRATTKQKRSRDS
jgi:hypothetical protein